MEKERREGRKLIGMGRRGNISSGEIYKLEGYIA